MDSYTRGFTDDTMVMYICEYSTDAEKTTYRGGANTAPTSKKQRRASIGATPPNHVTIKLQDMGEDTDSGMSREKDEQNVDCLLCVHCSRYEYEQLHVFFSSLVFP